jgi:hypothetical protein
LLDRLGEGRLGHEKPFGRAPEVQLVSQRQKRSQVPQFEPVGHGGQW